VHAAIEPGLAGEQEPLSMSFWLLAEFVFSCCRGLPMSIPWMQTQIFKHTIKILFPRFFTELNLRPRPLDMTSAILSILNYTAAPLQPLTDENIPGKAIDIS
jgi:hypothetical protein